MRPRVVFALQSPTLLNILATSRRWSLSVADLGDHPGQETMLLTAPRYDGGGADHVFVCTPEHWRRAHEEFKDAKIWWVAHNAKPHVIPWDIQPERVLCLSQRVRDAQRLLRPKTAFHIVTPWYEPRRIWEGGTRAWTMISRPKTRDEEHLRNVRYVAELSRVQHELFGEGQRGGFLFPEERRDQQRRCSAYLSALPLWSGFGLAEHECLAAGVPIVGTWWGDTGVELWHYQGLHDSIDGQVDALWRLAEDRAFGETLSETGLDFVARARTLEIMEEDIAELLELSESE